MSPQAMTELLLIARPIVLALDRWRWPCPSNHHGRMISMVAKLRTRLAEKGSLWVRFTREDHVIEERSIPSGEAAVRASISMLAQHEKLFAGDTLFILANDGT
jgi:hypothetical protein